MIEWHKKNDNFLTILGVKKTTKISYGILRLDKDNNVFKIGLKLEFSIVVSYCSIIICNYIYIADGLLANVINYQARYIGSNQGN